MIWIQGTVHFVQWNTNQNITKFFNIDRACCDKMSASNHGLVGPSNPATTPHPFTSHGGSNVSQDFQHLAGTNYFEYFFDMSEAL